MSLVSARGGRALVAVLLLLATVVFVIGVSIEKAEEGEHSEPAAATTAHPSEAGELPATESAAADRGSETADGHEEESLLGIETESTALIILGVALSLVAAGAVWWFGDRRWVLGLVALFGLGFAALDGVEAWRKLDNETTIAALALLALMLHLAAGLRAGMLAGPLGPDVAGETRIVRR